jgi:predicted nucleotidyltransferase
MSCKVSERFGLPEEDVARYQAVFATYPQIRQVLIYGSRAKGTHRPASDIDLTIVGDLDWPTFTRIEAEIDELLLPYQVDLSLYSQIDNPALIEHIQRVGKTFFQS